MSYKGTPTKGPDAKGPIYLQHFRSFIFNKKIGFGFCSLDLHIVEKKIEKRQKGIFFKFFKSTFFHNYLEHNLT
jgi:hypothetical protein